MFLSQAAKAVKYASSNPGKLATLLEKDPSLVNCRDPEDRTLLHIVSGKAGNMTLVDLLIAKGADINSVDSLNHTPLYYAVQHNWLNIIEKLLEHNALLAINDGSGQTLFHVAAAQTGNCVRAMELLANKGEIDINAVEMEGGKTAFLVALQSGNKNAAIFCIDYGADLTIEDSIQRSYKHFHPERLGLDQYIAVKMKSTTAKGAHQNSPKKAAIEKNISFAVNSIKSSDSTRQIRTMTTRQPKYDAEYDMRMEPVSAGPGGRHPPKAKSLRFQEVMDKRHEQAALPVQQPSPADMLPKGAVSFRKKSFLRLKGAADEPVSVTATPQGHDCSLNPFCVFRW